MVRRLCGWMPKEFKWLSLEEQDAIVATLIMTESIKRRQEIIGSVTGYESWEQFIEKIG